MLKIINAEDITTGARRILVEGVTLLEKRFITWFSCEHAIDKIRLNNGDALMFDAENDIDQLETNMKAAFQAFKTRFNYFEVPQVIGMTLDDATGKITEAGLTWAIEAEKPSEQYTDGYIIEQAPEDGLTSSPYHPIRLTICNNKSKIMQDKQENTKESEDEVFKRFLN